MGQSHAGKPSRSRTADHVLSCRSREDYVFQSYDTPTRDRQIREAQRRIDDQRARAADGRVKNPSSGGERFSAIALVGAWKPPPAGCAMSTWKRSAAAREPVPKEAPVGREPTRVVTYDEDDRSDV